MILISVHYQRTYLRVYTLQRMWNGGITNVGRGRGSSVDRGGRGRTGRGSLYSHYSRGVGFDDSADGIRIEGQSFQVKKKKLEKMRPSVLSLSFPFLRDI